MDNSILTTLLFYIIIKISKKKKTQGFPTNENKQVRKKIEKFGEIFLSVVKHYFNLMAKFTAKWPIKYKNKLSATHRAINKDYKRYKKERKKHKYQ